MEVVEAMNIICPKDLYVSATLFFLLCCYLLVGKVSSRIATYIVSNQCRWVTNKLHKFQSSPPHSYDIDVWAIKCSVQRLIVNCFIWKPYDRCKERQHFVAISKNGLRLDVAYTCRSFAQLHSNTNENWFVVRRFVDFLDSIFWFESFSSLKGNALNAVVEESKCHNEKMHQKSPDMTNCLLYSSQKFKCI